MFCTKCGSQVPEGMAFCVQCGAPVKGASAAQSPDVTQVMTAGQPVGTGYVEPIQDPSTGGHGKTIAVVAACAVVVLAAALTAVLFIGGIGPFDDGSGDDTKTSQKADKDDKEAEGKTEESSAKTEKDDSDEKGAEDEADTSVEVPDLAGMYQEDAEKVLADNGLVLGTVTEQHDEAVEKGAVVSQGTSPGERVDAGAAVDLVVSSGPVVHTYEVISEAMTWEDAKAYCESQGGYLATITSAEENDKVKAAVAATDRKVFWIGAKRGSGDAFEWVSGEAFSYNDWAAGEPNDDQGIEDYSAILITPEGAMAWYDVPNDVSEFYKSDKLAFVMEKEE
ncbi:Serine/threonine-protein kinase PrkC [Slackia heliotrinireducens]|uniref:Uncharacterized conserved protein n=1 Tax=Slackia heliotrinireducens (strain ATCC 29202 / DSM 20476 / NCTC 11029 / RHS 1) TaxID=471855 RepID=C7N136_SLAHD|nr:PASTA domain-containing protein [Slackia heliotrinireducens]ACV23258.1 uncharacterized conserved protein [Slackia heliotrinireducens DSM 20476]VEH02408.1 Serine/threonine-protein kinase PrkC [Slackia heliotrinireducens]